MVLMKFNVLKAVAVMTISGIVLMIISPFLLKAVMIQVTQPEVLLNAEQRLALNLHTWPDGNIGIVKNNEQFTFFGTNGGLLSKTSGTIANPTQQIHYTSRTIQSLKETYNYAGGGPTFEINDYLFMLYHAEYHPNNHFQQFYSTIGIAYSTNEGEEFFDLGKIIQSTYVLNENDEIAVEMGGAPFVIKEDYIYVFFRDIINPFQQNNLAVARCSIEELMNAVLANQTPVFNKYFQNRFLESGIGGRSTQLEFFNGNIRWFDIGFDTKKNQYMAVLVDDTINGQNLYVMFSYDLFSWGPRINLTWRDGETFYPTLIGYHDNPKESDGRWWVYFTHSQLGAWSRWEDATLERVLITL
ncbi:MAG: hypothetical protein RIS53_789 [Bacillota bacterium]|jgi:hypothetical protein